MIRILVNRPSRYPADTKKIKEAVKDTLSKNRVTSGEISVSIVGERKMKDLAQKYLGEENTLHEVLSFPSSDPINPNGFVYPDKEEFPLGDIVLCYPEARNIAMKKNRMVDDVLGGLASHGVLHLIGIHHEE